METPDLQHVLSTVPAVIFSFRVAPGMPLTYISESVRNILGYEPQRYCDEPDFWLRRLHVDDLAQIGMVFKALMEAGQTVWECRVLHANGAYRWFSCGLSVQQGATDPADGVIAYAVDIDAQKRAQEALTISEARWRSLVTQLPAAVIEIDRAGKILSANRPLPFAAQTIQELTPPPSMQELAVALEIVFGQGESYHLQIAAEPEPGSHLYLDSTFAPVRTETEITSAVVISLNTTNRVLAEMALRQERDFGRQVMDTVGQGLVVNDRELHIEYANPFMARLIGRSQEELIGQSVLNFVLPDDLPLIEEQRRRRRAGSTDTFELRLLDQAGTLHYLLVTSTPRIHDGEVIGSVSACADLTATKLMEQRLRQNGEELQAAIAALERAAHFKDEFLASMSHELRTPLTGILALAEVLRADVYGPLNERQARAVANIEIGGRHLIDLINDILDLAKIEAGKLELELDSCNLNEVCQASLLLTKGIAHQKHQQVSYQICPAGLTIVADVRRIKQMLVNLLSNAVKFTPEGGELGLEVAGDQAQQEVRLTVWDRGIGIQPEHLNRLFQPFTQLDTSLARTASGSGLGLSLVQRMAHLHGGWVNVDSAPGQGSRFTIVLPWQPAKTAPAGVEAAVTAAPTATDTSPTPSQARAIVLFAEDNPLILEATSVVLAANGYRVIAAADGHELLALAAQHNPDIILTDILMPGLDGLEAIRRLRRQADAEANPVPIVAITALAMPGDRERCLAAGANDYLSKPISMPVLLDTVRQLLAARRA